MNKSKTTSRKSILAAIRYEPLRSGSFVEGKEKNCPVCAVGATLRRAGFTNLQIDRFGTKLSLNGSVAHLPPDYIGLYNESREHNQEWAKQEVSRLVREKKYLHALSVKFEDQASRTGTGKRTRKVLARFVKENFPKLIELNPEL